MRKWSKRNRDMAGTQAAMIRATRRALSEAKLRGVPVPEWRNGKVVWVPPEEIEIPPLPDEDPGTTSDKPKTPH